MSLNALPVPSRKNSLTDKLDFLDLVEIPKDSYIYFVSRYGHQPIDPSKKELPPMKFFWAQIGLPNEPPPTYRQSKFYNDENDRFYVYKTIRPLTLLFISKSYDDKFMDKIIAQNKGFANKFKVYNPKTETGIPLDYIDTDLIYNLMDVDGIYNYLDEIVLFSPYDDKLEYVYSSYCKDAENDGGELRSEEEKMFNRGAPLEPGKNNWKEDVPAYKARETWYLNPTKELLFRARNALFKNDKYADKFRKLLKDEYKVVGAAAGAAAGAGGKKGGRRTKRRHMQRKTRRNRHLYKS